MPKQNFTNDYNGTKLTRYQYHSSDGFLNRVNLLTNTIFYEKNISFTFCAKYTMYTAYSYTVYGIATFYLKKFNEEVFSHLLISEFFYVLLMTCIFQVTNDDVNFPRSNITFTTFGKRNSHASDTSSAYSGSDVMQSSLSGEINTDLSGLSETLVDSDEEESYLDFGETVSNI